MPATVRVRGEATIRVEPDAALLVVTLTALEDRPGTALSDVSRRSDALLAMLDRLGIASADRFTAGITVQEEFDHSSGRRQSLGHRAANQVAIRLTNHELIGQVIAEATEQLSAQIDGPRWQIARENPVRLQAAREAAADAQRRGQAYAEGVGARPGRAVELSEDPGDARPIRVRTGWHAAGGETFPVESGEQEVLASVLITFSLEFDDR